MGSRVGCRQSTQAGIGWDTGRGSGAIGPSLTGTDTGGSVCLPAALAQ